MISKIGDEVLETSKTDQKSQVDEHKVEHDETEAIKAVSQNCRRTETTDLRSGDSHYD